MLRAVSVRHQLGKRPFVKRTFLKPDGQRRNRPAGFLGRHGRYQPAVDAPRQKHPHRHVRSKAKPNRLTQQAINPLDRLLLGKSRLRLVLEPPIRPRFAHFTITHDQHVPRQHHAHMPIDRSRRGDDHPRQVVQQGLAVDVRRSVMDGQQTLDFRGKPKLVRQLRVIQRLLARPVPGKQKLALATIPDSQREHSPKPRDEIRSQLLVKMNNHLGIARRPERMSSAGQLIAKLAVVVNFAIENSYDRPILIGDRLAAAWQVDDGQPAVHKA